MTPQPQIAYGIELVRLAILRNRLPHSSDRAGTAEDWVKHSPVLPDDDKGENTVIYLRRRDGALSVDFRANPFEPADDYLAFEWPVSAHTKLAMIGRLEDMLAGKETPASIRY